MTDLVQESIMEELSSKRIQSFPQFDKNFKFIPKVLSRIIYSYSNPVCEKCDECCKFCKFYCYYECLRVDRDVCCKYELGSQINKYSHDIVIDIIDNIIGVHIEPEPA